MTQRANPAANGLCAVRSSVAGIRERTVRSTRAAEARRWVQHIIICQLRHVSSEEH